MRQMQKNTRLGGRAEKGRNEYEQSVNERKNENENNFHGYQLKMKIIFTKRGSEFSKNRAFAVRKYRNMKKFSKKHKKPLTNKNNCAKIGIVKVNFIISEK